MLLTIQEACQRLGVSDSTMRRRIREGRVHAEKQGNVWLVEVPEDYETLTSTETIHYDKEVESLYELIAFLKEQIAVKDGQIGQMLGEMKELRLLALPAPKKETEKRESRWRKLLWG